METAGARSCLVRAAILPSLTTETQESYDMKPMILTVAATLGLAGAAFAQADFTSMDADNDGMLSMTEMLVALPTLTEDGFVAMDTDEDGMISQEELSAAEQAGLLPMSSEG
jgi:Ca2+-binding EF-hand superfamily protein